MARIKSRQCFDQNQLDMRDIPGLMPEVFSIQCSDSVGYTWTDAGIDELKEGLMIESIRGLLDKRCSDKTWIDIYSWMVSDDLHPFSFKHISSHVMGADHERYRTAILELIKLRNPQRYERSVH